MSRSSASDQSPQLQTELQQKLKGAVLTPTQINQPQLSIPNTTEEHVTPSGSAQELSITATSSPANRSAQRKRSAEESDNKQAESNPKRRDNTGL